MVGYTLRCPHCGAQVVAVSETNLKCPMCGRYFDVLSMWYVGYTSSTVTSTTETAEVEYYGDC